MTNHRIKEIIVSGGDPYTDLASSIVYSAIVDYRNAHKRLRRVNKEKKVLLEKAKEFPYIFQDVERFKQSTRLVRKHGENDSETIKKVAECKQIRSRLSKLCSIESDSLRVIKECELFFKSPWMEQLSTIGGKTIKNMIDKELVAKGYELLEEYESEDN